MEQLRQITEALLRPDRSGEQDDAALKLYSLFSAISGLHDEPAGSADDLSTVLATGEAVSPRDAARCVIDSVRTSKFLRGIYAALREVQRRFPDGPIEILYAGCGPFAALAIPLTAQFKADQIQFTLLDMHTRSLEIARHLVETLGLQDYVRNYVQGDAVTYVHPRRLHMVITETMQKALSKEPQVAITLNLAPQLRPGGIFIPERVTIDAYLCDPRKEFALTDRDRNESPSLTRHAGGFRVKLGKVFELTAEKACELGTIDDKQKCAMEAYLPATAIDLPAEIAEGLTLMLATTITVFGAITLDEYESGLTHPFWFHDFRGTQTRDRIEIQYGFRSSPGFKWQAPQCVSYCSP